MNIKILTLLLILNHNLYASQAKKDIAWGMISRANGAVKQNENGQLKMYLEDTFKYEHTSKGALFVIADGHNNPHGKNRSCDKIQKMLPYFFKQSSKTTEESLKEALSSVEDLANEYDPKRDLTDGSTALAICIDPTGCAICANIGDSRAIAFSSASCTFATQDHHIDNKEEIERIRKHVGDSEFNKKIKKTGNTITSFNSSKLTRFIGNPEAKKLTKKNRKNESPFIATPDIYKIINNRYLIMATDGFWDAFHNDQANDGVALTVMKLMEHSIEQLNNLCTEEIKMTIDRCETFALANMLATTLGYAKTKDLADELEKKDLYAILQNRNVPNDQRSCDLIVERFKENGLNYFEEKEKRLNKIPQCPDIIVEEEGCGVQSEKCRLIASILAQAAIRKGSKDNITVCVIDLHASHSIIDRLKYCWRLNKSMFILSLPFLLAFVVIVNLIHTTFIQR